MKIIKSILIFLGVFCIFTVSSSFADVVEIFAPETENHAKIELMPEESAELTIYLKSLGDLLYGYKIYLYNTKGELVGQTFSDENGIAIFTKIPTGKYMITVEKKINERGGDTRINVGDMNIKKTKSAVKILKGNN